MKFREPVPIEVLRSSLDYDPHQGTLIWKPRAASQFVDAKRSAEHQCALWNSRHSGKPALNSVSNKGYATGFIFGKFMMAHRVCWAVHHGRWPSMQIDHIDGDRLNNRINNLREVSPVDNSRNRRPVKFKKSGLPPGVWNDRSGKYRAVISKSGKDYNLGLFADPMDAHAAYRAEAVKLGFHENHGRIL